jgi:hypothetical protein
MEAGPMMIVGKPRLIWLEDYLRELKWRKKANNRENWAAVIKESKFL